MRIINISSMAELKREAKPGRYMKGGYYSKSGADEWREIGKVQSNGVWLLRKGKGSWFMFPKAHDVEFVDGKIKIYEDRVKYGNSDMPADTQWLKWDLESGKVSESELVRYREQLAEYELGEE